MPALVGRAREVAEIDDALAGAAGGRGRLLLVGGAAGIGKSRLADAAVDRASGRGFAIAAGFAVDDPGAPALWPWRRALAAVGITEPLTGLAQDGFEPDAGARFQLFATLTDRLLAVAAPDGLLVVLEDLHWADALSLGLLRHLATEVPGHPIVVFATYRDVVDGPLPSALAELVRGNAVRPLGLAELTPAEVAVLLPALGVEADPALAAALHERTGGNPLLVRLVAEDLAARPGSLDRLMPERPHLRRLVVARLAPLSGAARELVDAAAVLGERLPPELLAATLGAPPERVRPLVDEAVAVGVFSADGDGVRFAHALVRDAAYAELPHDRRVRLHRAVAEALAGLGRDELAGSIAFHWRRAEGADAARQCLTWADRAVAVARSALSRADAVTFAGLAVDAARDVPAPPAEFARLLLRLAEAHALAHDLPNAVAVAEQAADLAERDGDAAVIAQAALVVQGTGDPWLLWGVQRLVERALAAAPSDAFALRARLTAQLAVCLVEHDEPERAAELAAVALAAAREAGDAEAQLDAVAARHLTISVPQQVTERLALGREAIALAGATRRPIAALWGHLWRVDAALQLGNLAEVQHELAEIDRVARDRASPLARWHHHRYSAVVDQLAGRLAEAREHNAASLEIGRRMDDFSMMSMYYVFELALAVMRGTIDGLDAEWARFVDAGPPIPLVKITRAVVAAVAGDKELARAEFAPFRELPDRYPVGPRWAGTIGQIAVVTELLDDAEVAGRIYPLLRPLANYYSGDGSGGVFSHGAVARMVADMARVAGRHDDAQRHYADAVAMNDRIGARPFSALSRLGWARTLVATDEDLPRAAELANVAATELRRLDLPGQLARAEALMAGIDRRRAASSPLSAREAEVARLVAGAQSNRQIADRLVLSERTVESHVRNILTKLGFTTRTEIATWFVQNEKVIR